jgi:hypothetical protein
VAVTEDGEVLFKKADQEGPSHAVQLGVFVDEALSYIDHHGIPFDAVAVSCGPGSYTGLRIGVSMAKGICYGRDLKLISVPTLELLCVPVLLYQEELPEDALLCPMIDARRMEVYAAIEPKICLWCCREESYNGVNIPKVYYDKEKMKQLGWLRMHPVTVTRRWMEQLGVKKHYVTKDGTNEIIL